MTNTVTFPTAVGGDGSTYTDDDNDTTGLAKGGHRARLVPMFIQAVAICALAVTNAASAAASAASALGAPGTNATSTTSLAIGSGSKVFTIQTGKLFSAGQYMVAASAADPTNQMVGLVTAHNSGTGALTLSIVSFSGSGTKTDWVLSLASQSGVQSLAGLQGAITASQAKTALAITTADVTDFQAVSDARAIAFAIAL